MSTKPPLPKEPTHPRRPIAGEALEILAQGIATLPENHREVFLSRLPPDTRAQVEEFMLQQKEGSS